jgi:hypothetical protein
VRNRLRCLGGITIILLFACSHLRMPKAHTPEFHQSIDIGVGASVVVSFDRIDAPIAAAVFHAVTEVAPKAARWGTLLSTVEVRIHPTHSALETAAGYKNLPWLRAWATPNVIHLQSPRTWGGGDTEDRLEELLLHEFTHTAMYQNCLPADETSAAKLKIPAWFLEGMASVTAEQGYRRLTPELIGRYISTFPEMNLMQPTAALYRDQRQLVYSTAHLAFLYLVESNGEASIETLLARMKSGVIFDKAFDEVFGESQSDFEDRLLAILRAAT